MAKLQYDNISLLERRDMCAHTYIKTGFLSHSIHKNKTKNRPAHYAGAQRPEIQGTSHITAYPPPCDLCQSGQTLCTRWWVRLSFQTQRAKSKKVKTYKRFVKIG